MAPPRDITLHIAIVVAGAFIAAALLINGRWQIGVAPGQIYRLDQWTGTVTSCSTGSGDRHGADSAMFQPGTDIPCQSR